MMGRKIFSTIIFGQKHCYFFLVVRAVRCDYLFSKEVGMQAFPKHQVACCNFFSFFSVPSVFYHQLLTCRVWSSDSSFLLAAEMEAFCAESSLSCSWASDSSCSAWRRPRSACSRRVRDSSSSFWRAFARRSLMPSCSRASSRARCSSSRAVWTSLSCCWYLLMFFCASALA